LSLRGGLARIPGFPSLPAILLYGPLGLLGGAIFFILSSWPGSSAEASKKSPELTTAAPIVGQGPELATSARTHGEESQKDQKYPVNVIRSQILAPQKEPVYISVYLND